MVQPNWYFNLKSGEPESPLGYLVQCLLESRARLGHPSTVPEEEEANVYLGHLLLAVMTPAYQETQARYVALTGVDVFHKVEAMRDPGEKFLLYRANADHQLLTHSVFRIPDAPASSDEGSTYYRFASEYHKQMYRRTTPVSTVLEHLSGAFRTYESILTHMRHAYFALWSGVSPEALHAWLRSSSESPEDP